MHTRGKTPGIIFGVIASLLAFFSAAACTPGSQSTSSGTSQAEPTPSPVPEFEPVKDIPYKIVVSTDMIRELAYMFARTRTTKAIVIIKPGVDPLTYKPTATDEEAIKGADLFLYNGLGLEPGLEPVIEKLRGKVRCAAITSNLTDADLIKSRNYPGGYDPHVWWGLDLWEKVLLNVVRILSQVDPQGEFDYGTTYQRYGESTSLLNHRYLGQWARSIPDERRILVTIHPSFAYFGRLYGYTVKSIYYPFETSYPPQRINELADYIISNKVPAIFPELGFSKKPIADLKAACDKKGYNVKIGKDIYSYSLSSDMNAKDYIYLNAGRIFTRNLYEALKTKEMMEMPN